MKNLQVGKFSSNNDLDCNPAKSRTSLESLSSSLIQHPTAEELRSQSEALLDTAINVAATQVWNGATREDREAAAFELVALINQRSPEHVARLEQERWERVQKDYGKPTVRA